MEPEKLIISPEEAEALLLDDAEYVHNYIDGGSIMLGCDFDREDAVAAFKSAVQIEIGGDGCKRIRHPIVVWDKPNHYSFFEADMAKVSALELARAAIKAAEASI